jgi:hypothetical protein
MCDEGMITIQKPLLLLKGSELVEWKNGDGIEAVRRKKVI